MVTAGKKSEHHANHTVELKTKGNRIITTKHEDAANTSNQYQNLKEENLILKKKVACLRSESKTEVDKLKRKAKTDSKQERVHLRKSNLANVSLLENELKKKQNKIDALTENNTTLARENEILKKEFLAYKAKADVSKMHPIKTENNRETRPYVTSETFETSAYKKDEKTNELNVRKTAKDELTATTQSILQKRDLKRLNKNSLIKNGQHRVHVNEKVKQITKQTEQITIPQSNDSGNVIRKMETENETLQKSYSKLEDRHRQLGECNQTTEDASMKEQHGNCLETECANTQHDKLNIAKKSISDLRPVKSQSREKAGLFKSQGSGKECTFEMNNKFVTASSNYHRTKYKQVKLDPSAQRVCRVIKDPDKSPAKILFDTKQQRERVKTNTVAGRVFQVNQLITEHTTGLRGRKVKRKHDKLRETGTDTHTRLLNANRLTKTVNNQVVEESIDEALRDTTFRPDAKWEYDQFHNQRTKAYVTTTNESQQEKHEELQEMDKITLIENGQGGQMNDETELVCRPKKRPNAAKKLLQDQHGNVDESPPPVDRNRIHTTKDAGTMTNRADETSIWHDHSPEKHTGNKCCSEVVAVVHDLKAELGELQHNVLPLCFKYVDKQAKTERTVEELRDMNKYCDVMIMELRREKECLQNKTLLIERTLFFKTGYKKACLSRHGKAKLRKLKRLSIPGRK